MLNWRRSEDIPEDGRVSVVVDELARYGVALSGHAPSDRLKIKQP